MSNSDTVLETTIRRQEENCPLSEKVKFVYAYFTAMVMLKPKTLPRNTLCDILFSNRLRSIVRIGTSYNVLFVFWPFKWFHELLEHSR